MSNQQIVNACFEAHVNRISEKIDELNVLVGYLLRDALDCSSEDQPGKGDLRDKIEYIGEHYKSNPILDWSNPKVITGPKGETLYMQTMPDGFDLGMD